MKPPPRQSGRLQKKGAVAMRDFFISYNKADREWAEWIADVLEDAGYTTIIQAWDFRPGMNFVLAMNHAAAATKRTIAVLSPDYLAAMFTAAEWSTVLARDPGGRAATLLPVRIARCELPPALAPIVYCDLVELDEGSARTALLAAVRQGRVRPVGKRAFPAGKIAGTAAARSPTSDGALRDAARALIDVLDTTFRTFVVQNRLRNQLVARMRKRLGVTERLQYEAFFHKYFDSMDAEELRLHAIIRGYTVEALSKYNEHALRIVRDHPELGTHIPSLKKLREHLDIWLAKYRSVFRKTPSMCLVYVGVEEGVPFPSAIDRELSDYVAGTSATPARRKTTRKRKATSSKRRVTGERRRRVEDF